MSAPAFTLLIRNRIHECAPDHSVETITVGELRKAAATMAELYEALEAANNAINAAQAEIEAEWRDHDRIAEKHSAVVRAFREKRAAALAKARGEQ